MIPAARKNHPQTGISTYLLVLRRGIPKGIVPKPSFYFAPPGVSPGRCSSARVDGISVGGLVPALDRLRVSATWPGAACLPLYPRIPARKSPPYERDEEIRGQDPSADRPGEGKFGVGTGNLRLRDEGRADQFRAHARSAGVHVKAFRLR